jgi:hypothetical protein
MNGFILCTCDRCGNTIEIPTNRLSEEFHTVCVCGKEIQSSERTGNCRFCGRGFNFAQAGYKSKPQDPTVSAKLGLK